MSRFSRRYRDLARNEQGAELIELAFVVPFFLVMIIGIIDFGGAWATRDQIAGAAQAGVRIAVNNFNDTTNPQCGGNPCTVQAAVNAAVTALNNAGLPTCGMDPAGISASGGAFTWSDSVPCNGGTFTITVARAVPEVDTSSGTNTTVLTTQVTVSYPYAFAIRMPTLPFFTDTFGPFIMLNRTVTMANLS